MDNNLRAESLIQAISVCTFVDTCPKHCNSSDQETCYGIVVDKILNSVQEWLKSHGEYIETSYDSTMSGGERYFGLLEEDWIAFMQKREDENY